MATILQSDAGERLYHELRPRMLVVRARLDSCDFAAVESTLEAATAWLDEATDSVVDEALLNDRFLLHRYIDLHAYYARLWQKIVQGEFSASWDLLQTALETIRLLKRLSAIDLAGPEEQLTALETAYPYRLFSSIGATAGRTECSICAQDIDTPDCIHRRGQLYHGQLAYAILREIKDFDHIALVTHPQDKRCVVQIADDSPSWALLRYIAELIQQRTIFISGFGGVHFTKRTVPNPDYRSLGRNEPCFCGSRKKFKRCCINARTIERDHVNITGALAPGASVPPIREPVLSLAK